MQGWILHERNEDNFKNLCFRKIEENKVNILDRKIVIWGDTKWGMIAKETLEIIGYQCSFFVDSKKEKQIKTLTRTPEILEPSKYYVIVATWTLYEEIERFLEEKKYQAKDYIYLVDNEKYNKVDVIYKNCLVGRYTTGYSWHSLANKNCHRILLIGDSVTRGLRSAMERLTEDIFAVDLFATSYSILDEMYSKYLFLFLSDKEYTYDYIILYYI